MSSLTKFFPEIVATERIVSVSSMRRSGQHAVMHWITNNIEGKFLLLNDVQMNVSPFRTTRGNIRSNTNCRIIRASPFFLGRLVPKKLLIYNYEDPCFPERYCYGVDTTGCKSATNVLVLRDIFNLFASRLKGLTRYSETGRVANVYKEMWRLHCDEYLGETKYLEDCIPISFNAWADSESYRQSLAEKMSLTLTENIQKLSQEGGGSSFESDATFRVENLFCRFQSQLKHPLYQQAFSGENELLEKNLEIFSDTLWEHRDALYALVNSEK